MQFLPQTPNPFVEMGNQQNQNLMKLAQFIMQYKGQERADQLAHLQEKTAAIREQKEIAQVKAILAKLDFDKEQFKASQQPSGFQEIGKEEKYVPGEFGEGEVQEKTTLKDINFNKLTQMGPTLQGVLAKSGLLGYGGKPVSTSQDFTLGPGQIRFEGGKPIAIGEPKEPKIPPSAGNAVDLAIKRKFGTEFLTDPKKAVEADNWLATQDGRKAVQQARDDLTPPSYVFPVTAEGIVPLKSRGEGAGQVKEGLGKPLPSEMVTFEGQVNQIKQGLKMVKDLYKPEFVGPLQGMVGTTKEKLGGISEEQAMFYAKMQEISNVIVYLYSGKQINENEYKRLMSSLPTRYLPDITFKTRMIGFEKTLESITGGRKSAMGGYGTQKPSQPETSKFKILKVE